MTPFQEDQETIRDLRADLVILKAERLESRWLVMEELAAAFESDAKMARKILELIISERVAAAQKSDTT